MHLHRRTVFDVYRVDDVLLQSRLTCCYTRWLKAAMLASMIRPLLPTAISTLLRVVWHQLLSPTTQSERLLLLHCTPPTLGCFVSLHWMQLSALGVLLGAKKALVVPADVTRFPFGGTGVRELTRSLATLPHRWIGAFSGHIQ